MDKETAQQLLQDALSNPDSTNLQGRKPNRKPLLIVITICLIIFGVTLLSSDPITGPYGKIISPAAGSLTDQAVNVTGETQNLEPGQYVWLAVDKPDIGPCWPKSPRIQPNTKFKTTIYEGGPKEPYTLSLYAVNKTINDQWQDWLDEKKLGGLPMPPDKRRLASVRLILGK